jgi:hypothetical protein
MHSDALKTTERIPGKQDRDVVPLMTIEDLHEGVVAGVRDPAKPEWDKQGLFEHVRGEQSLPGREMRDEVAGCPSRSGVRRSGPSQIGTSIRESALVFPLIETAHVIGLSVSVGLILLLDLRLVGAGFRRVPAAQILSQLKPWYLAGFTGMLLSGALLFWSEAFSCYQSPSFRWKIAFLCLAGLNAAVFEVVYKPQMDAWGSSTSSVPLGAQLVGWCSLVCWAAVIGFGRWTAYRLG